MHMRPTTSPVLLAQSAAMRLDSQSAAMRSDSAGRNTYYTKHVWSMAVVDRPSPALAHAHERMLPDPWLRALARMAPVRASS
jgi:hypothetical protein